ncbi:MAG TPA: glycosyltransferase family 1 protein [Bryobacteraceae bacterium]|jgi:glycosyltransferase involved in cell wall biosynthesis|nr:glycosyltransferase family 1 protein [Bryobacteraceae bacterium]
MLFSVDAHAVGCHLTGNEVYITNLLNQYAELDGDADFIAYVSRPEAFDRLPARFRKIRVSDNPYLRLGFELPRCLRRHRPDLLHVQYTAPLVASVPVVATVHDVSFLEHPEYFTKFRAVQLRITVKRTVRRAARILTPSEFSRRRIVNAYGVDESKVTVVPNGVSPVFRPVHAGAAAHWVRSRYNIPAPFVLTVGDLQPRKNHIRLIRAFEELLRAYPHLPHHLVMVGKETWRAAGVRRAAARSAVADRLHFTGWVPDEDLRYFYGACDLFVFPSLYEGFGIPIVEAMACARAVACSNTSAMPEVANAAAILFDPESVAEIARAMRDLILDAELRRRMERRGARRAALFSWSRAAQKTLDVYYDVAGVVRDAAPQPPRIPAARKLVR